MESERRSVIYSLSEQTADGNIYKNPGVVERQRLIACGRPSSHLRTSSSR